MVLTIAVPIMLQNGITNFVSLLDNIMIGRVGTEQMSGAAIVNQLLFVYYLCMFGGVSGAGIFTAQYFGQKDYEGVRNIARYKFWLALVLTSAAILLFLTGGENLIRLYLKGDGSSEAISATLRYSRQYLNIMLLGLDVLPEYRGQGLAKELVFQYCRREEEHGRKRMVLTCHENKVKLYRKLGFRDLGASGSTWGGEKWHEMDIFLAW